MKRFVLVVVLGCGAMGSTYAAPSTSISSPAATPLTLEKVIAEVVSTHPQLRAARARWEAAQARTPQAKAWADPRVGIDVERDNTRFNDYHANEWMVAQELPLSGKNRQRAVASRAEAGTAWSELRRHELDLVGRARQAYFRYANALVQLEINQRNDELLGQFIEISRDKYRFGTRMQGDVFMAETERVKNAETRRDLERDLSDAQSELNVLLSRPAGADLPPPEPMQFRALDLESRPSTALALQHRPELDMARQRIKAEEARVKLARRSWIPDPEVRVEARQFANTGRFEEYDTGVFFNFPWFNRRKYRGTIEEAKKNLESAEHELRREELQTGGMVRDQLKKIETYQHHYILFREQILPLAQQAVVANQAAYSTDKGSFLELLTAQRTVQEVEATTQHHLAQYLIALAELETMLGAPVLGQPGQGTPQPHH